MTIKLRKATERWVRDKEMNVEKPRMGSKPYSYEESQRVVLMF